MKKLLEGMRIIEFAARGGGPIGGVVLGDLGADVIKIENPVGGDPVRGTNRWLLGGIRAVPPEGHSVAFEFSDWNKRGITLDLTKEKGREVAYKLIENADAFLSNYQNDRLKKLGLDYKTLSKLNPRLVYATSTGYGKKGSDSEKITFDTMALARSGMIGTAVTDPDGTPGEIVGTIADCMGGTFLGIAVVFGLLARERFGFGQEINSSLFAPMIWAQYPNLSLYYMDGRTLPPRSSRTETPNAFMNSYKCKDGRWLILFNGDWSEFCQILGLRSLEKDPRFIDEAKRRENCKELIKILDIVFNTKTRGEWVQLFKARNVKFGYEVVNSITDLANDEQVKANNYVVEQDHPGLGHIKAVRFPMDFSKTPVDTIRKPAPQLGEHNVEVLTELGYSKKQISEMKKQKII